MSQIIYVKHDAAGSNTGTDWQNAYTSLHTALTAAVKGDQVWVAAGTYKTDPGTANSSFTLLAGVSMYGGFNGSETMLSARNPVTNLTTLSGDMMGNDIAGMFTTNRTDNSRHVINVIAGAEPTDRAIVDGFTISGGNTLIGTPNLDLTRRGGGILANAQLTVGNCRFVDNYGESGSSIAAIGPGGSGIIVNNCVFENNEATDQSAGILLRSVQSGTVRKAIFRNNKTNRGTLYILTSTAVTVDSCLFENNDAGANFGSAGYHALQSNHTLSNSIFTGNKSQNASAMYNDDRGGGHFATITNCLFENNTALDYGGTGLYNFKANYLMENCTFRGNAAPTSAGAIYNGDSSTFTVRGSYFEANTAGFAGAAANYGATQNGTYENCTFVGNKAITSGGAFNNGFGTKVTVINCTFENNEARFGAAISNQNATTQLTTSGSTYRSNIASDNGGAINLGAGITLNATNSTFELNTGAFGGAVSILGASGKGNFKGCTFKTNTAATSGGGIINGFKGSILVDSCHFEGNEARFGAGIFCQNDSTGIDVKNSRFTGNTAADNGAGVNVGAGINATVTDSYFDLNYANIGGGMEISEDSLDLTVGTITNCSFVNNFAESQGAGLNLSNADVTLTNCLLIQNINFSDTGAGGAISNNASADKTSPLTLINCTVADNTAPIGAGIALWEDDANGDATLALQNTILQNQSTGGTDYGIEAGTPVVTSLGGNLGGDASLSAALIATNDLDMMDPQFVDATAFDYHLKANSPCIDKAIAAAAPLLDLDGLPRKGAGPDQGCFEFQTIGTHNPNAQVLPLRLMPNPTVEQAVLVIENDWSGDVLVQITSQTGAVVKSFAATKPAGRWIQMLQVQNLPVGVYSVQVLAGKAFYEGSLVKQ